MVSRCHPPPGNTEDGFTLIELLIVLVIMPLVVGAVAIVLITVFENDQGVQHTVEDSSAAALGSSYYVRDIESAGSVTTNPSVTSPAPCSAAGLSGSTSFLLGVQLQGTTPTATVSYYTWTPAPGTAPELVREFCSNGSQSHEILSDNLSSTNLPSPTVSCISPTPTSIPTGVSCPATGNNWTPTYLVSNVTLNVTQGCVAANSGCASYQYALNGDPQSDVPIPPINEPCGVVTLRSPQNDISMGGNFTVFASEDLNAKGPIVLNSGYNTSGVNGAAISATSAFLSSVNVSATGTTCPDGTTVAPADAIGIYNCDNTSSSGTNTNFSTCPTSGQHETVSGVNLSPNPPVQISTGPNQNGITDPLLTWASQQQITNPTSPVTCPPSMNMNCPSGLYTSALTIPNNATVTFNPGPYEFSGSVNCSGTGTQTSLCIQNNDTVNFGSGSYTFLNGIDVSGSGSSLRGSGVMFYVKSGETNLGNYFSSTNIQLSAAAGNPVLLWQDSGDNDQVVLSSPNTNATNTLAGEIYAPSAQVFINGYGGSVATQDIDAWTLAFGGTAFNNLTLTVSPAP
jgi:prepilin-type N-terminal cleavage/methylation domain-containing protein